MQAKNISLRFDIEIEMWKPANWNTDTLESMCKGPKQIKKQQLKELDEGHMLRAW